MGFPQRLGRLLGIAADVVPQRGFDALELLDAVNKRFRLKVALEGAVAEVQMEKKINSLVGSVIERYEAYDIDGHPDFGIWLPGSTERLPAECKNVRDHEEAYREGGEVVAYKVETQKTRASILLQRMKPRNRRKVTLFTRHYTMPCSAFGQIGGHATGSAISDRP